eukprot:scaffold4178_cov101-Isochrysis_galbana.AAC.1
MKIVVVGRRSGYSQPCSQLLPAGDPVNGRLESLPHEADAQEKKTIPYRPHAPVNRRFTPLHDQADEGRRHATPDETDYIWMHAVGEALGLSEEHGSKLTGEGAVNAAGRPVHTLPIHPFHTSICLTATGSPYSVAADTTDDDPRPIGLPQCS